MLSVKNLGSYTEVAAYLGGEGDGRCMHSIHQNVSLCSPLLLALARTSPLPCVAGPPLPLTCVRPTHVSSIHPPSPSSGRRYGINIIIYVNQVRRPDITGRCDLLQSMKCSHLPFQADLGS